MLDFTNDFNNQVKQDIILVVLLTGGTSVFLPKAGNTMWEGITWICYRCLRLQVIQ